LQGKVILSRKLLQKLAELGFDLPQPPLEACEFDIIQGIDRKALWIQHSTLAVRNIGIPLSSMAQNLFLQSFISLISSI
jgi:hypothetical protein